MKTINKIHVKDFLANIGVDYKEINYGMFDRIGESLARRYRAPDSPEYRKYGMGYRANYERGIVIYYLIKEFGLETFLEIGFGRGYATACALKSFHDHGINGRVVTMAPDLDNSMLNAMASAIPEVNINQSNFHPLAATSNKVKQQTDIFNEMYDLIYVDGDHSEEGVRQDCSYVKDIWSQYLLFDDYHTEEKESFIQCRKPIDELELDGELIIMDRRLFMDERQLSDEEITYGQMLFSKNKQ